MADRLLVHLLGDGGHLPLHDLGDARAHRGGEELAERYHPQQALLAVEHVAVVDRAGLLAHLLAHVADRLVDGHLRAQPDVARVHEPARVVLRVGEERSHLAAGRLVEEPEQRVPLLRRRRLDEIGRVVGREEPHPRPLLAPRHAAHQVRLIARRQPEEEVLRLVARQEEKPVDPIAVRQERPDVADLPQRERLASSAAGGGGGAAASMTVTSERRVTRPRLARSRIRGGIRRPRRTAGRTPSRTGPCAGGRPPRDRRRLWRPP